MRFSIVTLFPEMVSGVLHNGLLKRAQDRGLLEFRLIQIRDYADPPHFRVDDTPYGGGPGMVMKSDCMDRAVQAAGAGHVIHFSPQGRRFTQADAVRLAVKGHLVLVCSRYEGVDERWVTACVDEELSLGDFVLSGGEVPALAVVEAVSRLLPGVVGNAESVARDSFSNGLLDHPHFTRPVVWEGRSPPVVLLSGDHGAVEGWRRRQSLIRTLVRRSDLVSTADLSRTERRLLEAMVQAMAEESSEG